MEEKLRRCLDGELDPGELPPALRRRVRGWSAAIAALRRSLPDAAPRGLVPGVMRRVREEDPGAPSRRGG